MGLFSKLAGIGALVAGMFGFHRYVRKRDNSAPPPRKTPLELYHMLKHHRRLAAQLVSRGADRAEIAKALRVPVDSPYLDSVLQGMEV